MSIRNSIAWCSFYHNASEDIKTKAFLELIFDVLSGFVGVGLVASGTYAFYTDNSAYCFLGLAINAAFELIIGAHLYLEGHEDKSNKRDNRSYVLGLLTKLTSFIGWTMVAAGYQEGLDVLGITSLIDVIDIPLSSCLMASRTTARPRIK